MDSLRDKFLNSNTENTNQNTDVLQNNEKLSLRDKFLNSKEQSFENPELDDSEIDRGIENAITGMGLRAAGQIVALPGNVRDLFNETGEQAKNLRKKLYSKFGLQFDEDFIRNNFVSDKGTDYLEPFKFVLNKLPNSEDVNKFIDEMAEGAYIPKSDTQKVANEFAEDIVNSFLARGPKNLLRNFLIPGLGVLVRKGLEAFGVDENKQNYGKLFTNIILNMANISNPKQMLGNRMRAERRMIPTNSEITLRPRDVRFLDNLINRFESGGSRPSTSAALTKAREFRNRIHNNRIEATQVHDFYRAINELKTNYGAFNVEGASKPAHVFNLNRVQQLNRNLLNRYGRNQNPRFLRNFRESNGAWAALEESDAIASYVKKHYNKPFVSEASKSLFAKSNATIPIAAGLTALERTQSLAQRLRNPILRRYYGNVLRYAAENNAPLMINNLNKLDNYADKMGL